MIAKLIAWATGAALPYVAGAVLLALVLIGWRINDAAVDRTEKRVNAEWQAGVDATNQAYADATLEATELRQELRAGAAQVARPALKRKDQWYANRPADRDAICLPADRLRSVLSAREAIAAAGRGDRSGETDAEPDGSPGGSEAPER